MQSEKVESKAILIFLVQATKWMVDVLTEVRNTGRWEGLGREMESEIQFELIEFAITSRHLIGYWVGS